MEGVIDFLTDTNNEEAEFLRKQCNFLIIPMMNPDGVIHGNYRCSLAGLDLNRQWEHPSRVKKNIKIKLIIITIYIYYMYCVILIIYIVS